jgi:NAD(P)-dependent dehydrogenase (short-subunit alcohol dehydrogenase family)
MALALMDGAVDICRQVTPVTLANIAASATWPRADVAALYNLTGTCHCIQSAIGDLIAKKWDRIITISSQSAQSGAPNRARSKPTSFPSLDTLVPFIPVRRVGTPADLPEACFAADSGRRWHESCSSDSRTLRCAALCQGV